MQKIIVFGIAFILILAISILWVCLIDDAESEWQVRKDEGESKDKFWGEFP